MTNIVIDPVPPGTPNGQPLIHKADLDCSPPTPQCGAGDRTWPPFAYQPTTGDVTCPHCGTAFPRISRIEALSEGGPSAAIALLTASEDRALLTASKDSPLSAQARAAVPEVAAYLETVAAEYSSKTVRDGLMVAANLLRKATTTAVGG